MMRHGLPDLHRGRLGAGAAQVDCALQDVEPERRAKECRAGRDQPTGNLQRECGIQDRRKAVPADRQRRQIAHQLRVARGRHGADAGSQGRMPPQRLEQVDAVDIEQDGQQQRQQERHQQLAPLVDARQARHGAVEPAAQRRLEALHVATGLHVQRVQCAPQLRIGHGGDGTVERGAARADGVDQGKREVGRFDVGWTGMAWRIRVGEVVMRTDQEVRVDCARRAGKLWVAQHALDAGAQHAGAQAERGR